MSWVSVKEEAIYTKAATDIRMFEYLPKLFTISNIQTSEYLILYLPPSIQYFYFPSFNHLSKFMRNLTYSENLESNKHGGQRIS